MKRVFWASFGVLLLVVAAQRAAVGEEYLRNEPDALERHLETAMSQMDPGMRSPDYRESIAFLRDHADEALERLSSQVLDEPGSVRKWQVTYLIGEFGNERAIVLNGHVKIVRMCRPLRLCSRQFSAPHSTEMVDSGLVYMIFGSPGWLNWLS